MHVAAALFANLSRQLRRRRGVARLPARGRVGRRDVNLARNLQQFVLDRGKLFGGGFSPGFLSDSFCVRGRDFRIRLLHNVRFGGFEFNRFCRRHRGPHFGSLFQDSRGALRASDFLLFAFVQGSGVGARIFGERLAGKHVDIAGAARRRGCLLRRFAHGRGFDARRTRNFGGVFRFGESPAAIPAAATCDA